MFKENQVDLIFLCQVLDFFFLYSAHTVGNWHNKITSFKESNTFQVVFVSKGCIYTSCAGQKSWSQNCILSPVKTSKWIFLKLSDSSLQWNIHKASLSTLFFPATAVVCSQKQHFNLHIIRLKYTNQVGLFVWRCLCISWSPPALISNNCHHTEHNGNYPACKLCCLYLEPTIVIKVGRREKDRGAKQLGLV